LKRRFGRDPLGPHDPAVVWRYDAEPYPVPGNLQDLKLNVAVDGDPLSRFTTENQHRTSSLILLMTNTGPATFHCRFEL